MSSEDEVQDGASPMVSDSDSDEMDVKVEVKKEGKKRKLSRDESRKKLKKKSKKIDDSDDEGNDKEMVEKEASESDDGDGSDDEDEGDSDNEYQADGFVVDDMEDSDDDDNSARHRRHRKKKEKKLRRLKQKIDEIDDEDLMLVRENLGMDTGRAHSDDDSDDDDVAHSSRKKKDEDSGLMSRDLAYRMFGDSDDEEEEGDAPARNNNYLGTDDYESDDIDEFIVDDDEEGGREGPRRRRKQAPLPPSMQGPSIYQMGEAEELFGDMEGFLEATRGAAGAEGKGEPKSAKAVLLDKYEPDVLKEHMMTQEVATVRETDIPERYQKLFPDRQFPDAEDRAEESEWISNFIVESINKRYTNANISRGEIVQSIDSVLRFYHDEKLEPAFVQRYCKEFWKSSSDAVAGLHSEDLYAILELDVKWDKLVQKKKVFQGGKDRAVESARPKEARFVRQCLDHIESGMDEKGYQDLAEFFALDAPESQKEDAAASDRQYRRPSRRNFYQICTKSGGLRPVANAFTMNATVLGGLLVQESQDLTLRDIPTPDQSPDTFAKSFVSKEFPSADDVMKGARHIAATKLAAEPNVRKYLRERYRQDAVLSTEPTRKGLEDIDEFHYCHGLQHLENMPVLAVFAHGDLWLRLTRAEKEGLVQITIVYPDPSKMVEEVATIYQNRTDRLDDEWETQRFLAVQEAVGVFLIPSFENELRRDFLVSSREHVVKQCGQAMRERLRVRPYDTRDGVEPFIVSVWVEDTPDAIAHLVALDENGEVVDKAQASFRRDEKHLRVMSSTLFGFLQENARTHVVVINTSGGMKCMDMGELLEAVRHELGRDTAERFGNNDGQDYLDILVMKDDVATMYSRSKRAEMEFPDESEAMRAAIGLGRYLRNPASELCAMWGNVTLDEPSRGRELLYLNVHPMQRSLVKDMLLREYDRVFVEVINKFGVDINQAVNHKHLSYQVQFISGLGPVKSTALLDRIRVKGFIERRQELLSKGLAGKIVYRNCAGFLRIREREALKEAPLNPLDDTRIHPESYYMAVKMCGDANNNSTIDMYDPNQYSYAVEDIMFQSATAIRNHGGSSNRRMGDNEIQDSLSELDLPAYAARLELQKKGPKLMTLEFIKRELRYPYFDKRLRYEPPQHEELFLLLHGETKETFRVGMIVPCTLLFASNEFVRVRLQNAMRATLRKDVLPDYITDDYVHANGFPKGITVNARVKDIRPDPSGNKFEVVLGCNEGCIMDIHLSYDPMSLPKYARTDLIEDDLKTLTRRLINNLPSDDQTVGNGKDPNAPLAQPKRKRRQVGHPLFHNWNCQQAMSYLRQQPAGDVVIRPSTLGTDHITLTWKMLDGVYRHFDVLEKDKPSEARLGQTLVIKDESFENIDEMVARFVDPMNELVEDVIKFKYYKNISEEQVHEELIKQKKEHPGRIPYIIHLYSRFPGCFSITYVARTTPRSCHMEVKPGGFRFFGRIESSLLPTLNQALQFFKMKALVAPAPKPVSYSSGSAPFAQQSASYSRDGGSAYWNGSRDRNGRPSRFEPRRDDRRDGGYGYHRDGGHYETSGGYR